MILKKKIAFQTFGCRLNQSETNYISRALNEKGFIITHEKDDFDILVVNTCTVTENGDQETRKLLRKVKQTHPLAKVALVGCQVESEREKLLEIENVQWIVGNENKFNLASVLNKDIAAGKKIADIQTISRKAFTQPFLGLDGTRKRANVKIQDGCDAFCSFCVIPFTRGRARSREYEDILTEVLNVSSSGCKEIVLTGVNLGTYAFDGLKFHDMLKGLLKASPEVRFRISSIEPTTIHDEVITYMSEYSNLCRYLHIPIQSACDKIIEAMNRHYTREWLKSYFKRLQETIPDIGLGTDVIVGFPGESDQDFDETYSFLDESALAYFHVFSYSERERTRSIKMSDLVPEQVIQSRSKRLRDLSLKNRQQFMNRFVGKTCLVIAEYRRHGYWYGFNEQYVRVRFKYSGEVENTLVPVLCQTIDGPVMEGILQ